MVLAAPGDIAAIIGVLSIAAILALIVVARVLTERKAASTPREAPAFAVRTASDPVPGQPMPVLEYASPPERIVLKYEMTRDELLLISRLPKSGPPADPSKDPVLQQHNGQRKQKPLKAGLFGWLVFIGLAVVMVFLLNQQQPRGRPRSTRPQPDAPPQSDLQRIGRPIGFVGAGIGVGAVALSMFLGVRRTKQVREELLRDEAGQTTTTIDHRGITNESPSSTIWMSAWGFVELADQGGFFRLNFNGDRFAAIPKRAFASPQDLQGFVSLVQERWRVEKGLAAAADDQLVLPPELEPAADQILANCRSSFTESDARRWAVRSMKHAARHSSYFLAVCGLLLAFASSILLIFAHVFYWALLSVASGSMLYSLWRLILFIPDKRMRDLLGAFVTEDNPISATLTERTLLTRGNQRIGAWPWRRIEYVTAADGIITAQIRHLGTALVAHDSAFDSAGERETFIRLMRERVEAG